MKAKFIFHFTDGSLISHTYECTNEYEQELIDLCNNGNECLVDLKEPLSPSKPFHNIYCGEHKFKSINLLLVKYVSIRII